MKILFLSCDSNGGYPIPPSKDGAVSILVDSLLKENEKKQSVDFTVLSLYDSTAFNMAHEYSYCHFFWVRIPKIIRFFDSLLYFFVKSFFKKKKSISYKSVFSLLTYIRKAKKLINKNQFDEVIIENNILLSLALKNTKGIHYVFHLHNIPRTNAHCIKIIQGADSFICVSNFVAKRIQSGDNPIGPIDANKCVTLYNSIDSTLFNPFLKNNDKILNLRKQLNIGSEKVILFVGRLTEEKGVNLILEALESIKERFDFKILIVGSYHYYNNEKNSYQRLLRSFIQSYGNHLTFTGYVKHEDLPLYYNLADIGVFPSVWDEPAGLTNLEAMACGLPLITTDAGGIPEYVGNDAIVLHIGPGLQESIKENVIKLLEDEKLRNDYSIKEISRVNRLFTKERYYLNFVAEITKLIS
jgi:spore coat protein SA